MIRRGLIDPPGLPFGWRPLLLAGAAYAVILLIVVVLRAESSTDFRDFWRTAEHFRTTGEVRTDLGVHNYLPFFVIFMAPWSVLPLPAAIALFTVLSVVLFAASVWMLELLLAGPPGPRPRVALLVAVGLALPYFHATAVLGQVNVLVLFLVVASWLLAAGRREWTAGVALGLAVLVKLLPGLLLLLFLIQRRWRVALAALGVIVVLGLGMPLASLGPDATLRQHAEFYRGAVIAHAALTTLTAEKPIKAKYTNNALPIVLRRTLSPVNGDPHEDGRTLFVNVAVLPRPFILGAYGGIMAGLVGVSGWLALRHARWSAQPTPALLARNHTVFGGWVILALLAAPLVWTHYLVLALPALAVLADRLEQQWAEHRRICRAAATGLAAWLLAAILLAWPAARAAGAQLAGCLVLWGALAVIAAGSVPRGSADGASAAGR